MKAHLSLKLFVGLSTSAAQMHNSLRDLANEITIFICFIRQVSCLGLETTK